MNGDQQEHADQLYQLLDSSGPIGASIMSLAYSAKRMSVRMAETRLPG